MKFSKQLKESIFDNNISKNDFENAIKCHLSNKKRTMNERSFNKYKRSLEESAKTYPDRFVRKIMEKSSLNEQNDASKITFDIGNSIAEEIYEEIENKDIINKMVNKNKYFKKVGSSINKLKIIDVIPKNSENVDEWPEDKGVDELKELLFKKIRNNTNIKKKVEELYDEIANEMINKIEDRKK